MVQVGARKDGDQTAKGIIISIAPWISALQWTINNTPNMKIHVHLGIYHIHIHVYMYV